MKFNIWNLIIIIQTYIITQSIKVLLIFTFI